MATGKVLNAANSNSFSLSVGFKDIFYCCFSSSSSSEKEAEMGKKNDEASSGRTELTPVVLYKVGAKRKSSGEEEDDEGEERRERESVVIICKHLDNEGSVVADEFSDSAIDSASFRGSVDGEMRSGQTGESGEQTGFSRVMEESGLNPSEDVTEERIVLRSDKPEDEVPTDSTVAAVTEDDEKISVESAIGQCGRVRMTVDYDAGRHRLHVTIHEASDVPESERVNLSHSEIHLLLQHKAKKHRHQTKAKSGDQPHFEETFRFKVSSEELTETGLRVRLYRSEKFKKERLIGESYVAFSSLPLHEDHPHSFWLTLEPRINLATISAADEPLAKDEIAMIRGQSSMTSGPASEVMLGLSYNATTGRLTVEVIQGCNIRSSTTQKPPDTYIKLKLISPQGTEIARSKTAVRRRDPNPSFHETFMFHISEIQLHDVSLMVSACEHRSVKHSHTIGWFTMGHTNSSEESASHWKAMIENKGQQISRWHNLMIP